MLRHRRTTQITSRHWRNVLEEFLRFKLLNGISESTHDDYVRSVELLFKRYPDAWESYFKLEEAVQDHLRQKDIAPATFNSRLTYLRTFFNWCVEKGYLKKNPLAKIKKTKKKGLVSLQSA
ncbi:phage integrase SAM-like domain-containing protein [Paenibacillus sp. DMB20]|uniref:phage integrase SAM-like domain-containing protein n=1 Tax=Paenibacillus sp. DMB20 TaxID=1642570 RepID=UPI000B1918CC|nr:phage integrase SAM-like domain-containing protein [Paenibacillus sp. DMB20]